MAGYSDPDEDELARLREECEALQADLDTVWQVNRELLDREQSAFRVGHLRGCLLAAVVCNAVWLALLNGGWLA